MFFSKSTDTLDIGCDYECIRKRRLLLSPRSKLKVALFGREVL
jgi:hypothetical protein